jgi:hypothetical protein
MSLYLSSIHKSYFSGNAAFRIHHHEPHSQLCDATCSV